MNTTELRILSADLRALRAERALRQTTFGGQCHYFAQGVTPALRGFTDPFRQFRNAITDRPRPYWRPGDMAKA